MRPVGLFCLLCAYTATDTKGGLADGRKNDNACTQSAYE